MRPRRILMSSKHISTYLFHIIFRIPDILSEWNQLDGIFLKFPWCNIFQSDTIQIAWNETTGNTDELETHFNVSFSHKFPNILGEWNQRDWNFLNFLWCNIFSQIQNCMKWDRWEYSWAGNTFECIFYRKFFPSASDFEHLVNW